MNLAFKGSILRWGPRLVKLKCSNTTIRKSTADEAQYAVRFGEKVRCITGVQCTTLDAYCAQSKIKRIDVLKIDTEGFDFKVLQGSSVMLQKHAIKFVYFEFNDLQPREGRFGGASMPIDAFLRRHGYRFVASYNDYIATDGEMFSVSLFLLCRLLL